MQNKIVHIAIRVPSFGDANNLFGYLFSEHRTIVRESNIYPGPPWFISFHQLNGVVFELLGTKAGISGEGWKLDHIAIETDSYDELVAYLDGENAQFHDSYVDSTNNRTTFAVLPNGLSLEIIEVG